jgi:hypothetical protein
VKVADVKKNPTSRSKTSLLYFFRCRSEKVNIYDNAGDGRDISFLKKSQLFHGHSIFFFLEFIALKINLKILRTKSVKVINRG